MPFSARTNFLVFLALAFIILGSPATYKLTTKILGIVKVRTADAAGTPTNIGLVVHAAVFAAFAHLFLSLAK